MADTTTGAAAEQRRPDGMPKGVPFEHGRSGNPEGTSKYQVELRKAIEAQETPTRVCEVISAMHRDATSGKKSAPAAAKVYLGAVGVKLDGSATTKIDLSDAPPEVMTYLRGKIPAN